MRSFVAQIIAAAGDRQVASVASSFPGFVLYRTSNATLSSYGTTGYVDWTNVFEYQPGISADYVDLNTNPSRITIPSGFNKALKLTGQHGWKSRSGVNFGYSFGCFRRNQQNDILTSAYYNHAEGGIITGRDQGEVYSIHSPWYDNTIVSDGDYIEMVITSGFNTKDTTDHLKSWLMVEVRDAA